MSALSHYRCLPSPLTSARRAVVLLLALSCLGVLTGPVSADVRPYRLTHAESRVVLHLVDNICGDTWCEGDHAFRFRSFACHPKRGACVLRVQIASWSEQPMRWRWRAQRVRGFARYSDMVTTGPGGERSLRPAFYAAVGEAVRRIQATVP